MHIRLFLYLSIFISCASLSYQVEARDYETVSLSNEEQRWLADHKDIIVGGSPDWTPLNFSDQEGNSQGIANDYLQLISQYTGLKYRVITDEWQHNLEKIKDNKIHILGSVYKTKAR